MQERVGTATDAVKQQAAPFVTEKLGDAVKAVGQQMRQTSLPGRSEHLPETIHRGSDGQLHADMTGYGPVATSCPDQRPSPAASSGLVEPA